MIAGVLLMTVGAKIIGCIVVIVGVVAIFIAEGS
jgi:hypothetical protein